MTSSSDRHLVLHGLAVKKHAGAMAIADWIGLAPAAVATQLEQAVSGGRAAAAGGRFLLTPAGRLIVEAQYSRHYAAVRADTAVAAAYARFELVNNELKQLITDWQTRSIAGSRVANDHADADYDARIIDRLGAVQERVEPVLAAFATAMPRYGRYGGMLAHALERAEDGDTAWVSDATIASYHTVWFELHEDILRVLGRTRSE